jgi:hypothetical protein
VVIQSNKLAQTGQELRGLLDDPSVSAEEIKAKIKDVVRQVWGHGNRRQLTVFFLNRFLFFL